MEHEGSLPSSQELTIGPCHMPYECSQQPHDYFSKIHFNRTKEITAEKPMQCFDNCHLFPNKPHPLPIIHNARHSDIIAALTQTLQSHLKQR